MASKLDIERIIESTDIVQLVSEFVPLQKSGANFKGLCPFHNEKTPSFTVSPDKKIAHCFSCKKGGNAIQFLMDIKNITFNQAINELAKRNSINLEEYIEDKKTPQYTKYYEITKISKQFYQRNLHQTESGQIALEYLHKRGLDDETIKMFGIGLASNKMDVLYKVLKDLNYLELDMMDLGLIRKGDNGYYDLFTKRIMFPICDEEGNVVAYSGRIFNNDDKNQAKYINSPETFLYKKGLILYNLNMAKQAILKNKRVILHEGQMDVIASVKSGLSEAVCTLGTALTDAQTKLLKKYTNDVIICYDGDNAGISASIKAIEMFNKYQINVKLVLLPDKLDPDDYVKKYGNEAYLKYFNDNIIDSMEYRYLIALKDKNLKDNNVVEEIKNEIFSSINSLKSNTIKEVYLNKLANDLKVSFAALNNDYNYHYKRVRVSNYVENSFEVEKNQNYYYEEVKTSEYNYILHELRIFDYAKITKEKAIYIDSKGIIDALSDDNQKIWFKLIENYYDKYQVFDNARFLNVLNEQERNIYIENIKVQQNIKHIQVEYTDADLEEVLKALLKNKDKKSLDSLSNAIYNTSVEAEKIALIEEKIKLRREQDKKEKKKVGR